jgi:long-chain acyl-CoA synthetase
VTSVTYASTDTPVPESTLVELFFEVVSSRPDATAYQRFVSETELGDVSYRDVMRAAKRVAASLECAGLRRGDRAAILSENRPEWALADWGCLCAGVVDVPVYPTLTAHQVAFLLRDAGVGLVFTSTAEQMEKALGAASECPQDVSVVVLDPPAELPAGARSWDDFLRAGSERADEWSDEAFRERALEARPDEVATVLYTSGTTGDPKGVMLTHNNIASNVRAARMVFEVSETDNTVSFLPLSHILQRMVDYLFFWVGCRIAYPRSLQTLVDDLKVVRPTVLVAVPRIYEKIYNNVMDARGLKRALVGWAVRVADAVVGLRLEGTSPSGLLALQYRVADALVFSKVRAAVGGRLRFFVSGGGPLAPALNRFFYSIGLTILEGYGLTETSPVTNVNTVEHFRIGTVGKAVPSTEIRTAEDGEIFVRGPQVMKGYYGNAEATAEALDADGWFATGDIGEIDAEGFLRITDRKKDLIVTAGGKNVAPQPIENRLKTHPLVEQAIMIGDRRPYPALLIVPAFKPLEAWAASQGLTWSSRSDLVEHEAVVRHVESEIFAMLEDLASFETPKRVALLEEELTIENGFLTPTLKVKRQVVYDRLADVIDGLYAHEPAGASEE